MVQMTPRLNDKIAHMSGVKAAVKAHGVGIEARAKANLATHRAEGDAKVVGRKEDTDYVIELIDENAASIEFGREAGTSPGGHKYPAMDGTRIMRDAV